MPELPEVETVRNRLKELILGEKIEEIEIYYHKIVQNRSSDEFQKTLIKTTFSDILRKGKYLIFVLKDEEDNIIYMVSHLRMEGKYFYRNADDIVEENIKKHEHLIFKLKSGKILTYHDTRKFGTMHLFQNRNLVQVLSEKPLNVLGYEVSELEFDLKYLKQKMNHSARAMKTVLLDQSIVAGIGNIYADEILFLSKIHPMTMANTLTDEQLKEVIQNIKYVLDKAIALGGTTIHSFSVDGISGKFQNQLLVHTQKNCPTCNRKITKIRVGGRGTYYCETCQILK